MAEGGGDDPGQLRGRRNASPRALRGDSIQVEPGDGRGTSGEGHRLLRCLQAWVPRWRSSSARRDVGDAEPAVPVDHRRIGGGADEDVRQHLGNAWSTAGYTRRPWRRRARATRPSKRPPGVGPRCWSPKGPAFRAFQAARRRRSSQGCALPAARPGGSSVASSPNRPKKWQRSASPWPFQYRGTDMAGWPVRFADRREAAYSNPSIASWSSSFASASRSHKHGARRARASRSASGRGPEGERRRGQRGMSSASRSWNQRPARAPPRAPGAPPRPTRRHRNLRPICASIQVPGSNPRARAAFPSTRRRAGSSRRSPPPPAEVRLAQRAADRRMALRPRPGGRASRRARQRASRPPRSPGARRCPERSGCERDPAGSGVASQPPRDTAARAAGRRRARPRPLSCVASRRAALSGRCESARVPPRCRASPRQRTGHRVAPRVG